MSDLVGNPEDRFSNVAAHLVFTEKSKFSFYFIQYTGIFQFIRQAVKIQKPKIFENTNNFGTTLFLTF